MPNTVTAGSTERRQAVGGRRLMIILAAAVGTVAVWLLAHSVFGVKLTVKQGSSITTVTLQSVIVVTLLIGLLAWALLAVLERLTRAGGTVFTIIGVLFLLISLLGPLGAQTNAAKLSLAGEHLIAAIVIIGGLRSTARKR